MFNEGSITYIVSEDYPECVSLKEFIQEENDISLNQTIQIMKRIAIVLNSCAHHIVPLYHGHLRPSNILVSITKCIVLQEGWEDIGKRYRNPLAEEVHRNDKQRVDR